MVSCPCAWPAGEVGSNTPSPRSRRQSSAATYGSWANARRRSLFAAELQVGKERVSRRDRDDPAVVDCDPLEDETEDIVSLRGVPLPIPERTEVGKRGRRLPGVGEDWRLECREFGLQHALVGFVLLPRGVLAARF